MKSSFNPKRHRCGLAQSTLLAGLMVLMLGGVALASVLKLLNLKQQLADKQAAILALTSQNEQLQEQVDMLDSERRAVADRLETIKTQLVSKSGEVDQLRRAMSDVQAKYDVFEFEKTRLTEQVTRMTQERDDVTSRILALEAEKTDLEQAATRFRERYALLDRDYQQVALRLAELEHGSGGGGIQPTVRARMDPSVSAGASGMATARTSASLSASRPMPAWAPTASASVLPSEVMVKVSSVAPQPSLGAPAHSAMAHTIELPPIVVRKDIAISPRSIRGRVVEVNRGHQFLIIDQGAHDGVLTGMTFDIQRSGATMARATAVRVRPQLTACEVAPASGSPFPQVGDVAVQRVP